MTTRRIAKASEAIRETVSTTILFELKDPRVQNVTVLRAEAAPDLRTAKVYLSVMGNPKQQSLCLHGLESARGFIQAKLADRLQTKYTPVLKFILDPGVQRSAITAQLLKQDAERLALAGADPDADSDELSADRAGPADRAGHEDRPEGLAGDGVDAVEAGSEDAALVGAVAEVQPEREEAIRFDPELTSPPVTHPGAKPRRPRVSAPATKRRSGARSPGPSDASSPPRSKRSGPPGTARGTDQRSRGSPP